MGCKTIRRSGFDLGLTDGYLAAGIAEQGLAEYSYRRLRGLSSPWRRMDNFPQYAQVWVIGDKSWVSGTPPSLAEIAGEEQRSNYRMLFWRIRMDAERYFINAAAAFYQGGLQHQKRHIPRKAFQEKSTAVLEQLGARLFSDPEHPCAFFSELSVPTAYHGDS